jgi:hypothetical protein
MTGGGMAFDTSAAPNDDGDHLRNQ